MARVFVNDPDFYMNRRFGYLTVTGTAPARIDRDSFLLLAQCDCGKTVEVGRASLQSSQRLSCGCKYFNGEDKTADTATFKAKYHTWLNLKESTEKPNPIRKMCVKWLLSFESFLNDIGQRPSKYHRLVSRDNGIDYNPATVYWRANKKSGLNDQPISQPVKSFSDTPRDIERLKDKINGEPIEEHPLSVLLGNRLPMNLKSKSRLCKGVR